MQSSTFGQAHPGKLYRLLAAYGLTDRTNLFWYYDKRRGLNFGDWIGPYLYFKKTGRTARRIQPEKFPHACAFFTVGSILHRIRRANVAIVWGSGAISADVTFAPPKTVAAVRGPLTRHLFASRGYPCPDLFGDPAILLPDYYPARAAGQTCEIGIIPHYADLERARRLFAGRDEIAIIDVRRPVEAVVDDIVRCRHTLSSSLHGLIVSHSYGIPGGWCEFSKDVVGDGFKFRDYFAASDPELVPQPLSVTEPISTAEIRDFVDRARLPDLDKLRRPLATACPF